MTAPVAEDLFPWNDPDFQNDPYPWYDRARAASPVHQTDEYTYVLTRYDDVMHYAKLPIMSIRESEKVANPTPWSAFDNTVLSKDPPEHASARRLFSRWFTPKLIKEWVEYTKEALDDVLAKYERGTVIDGHYDLGVIPTHITMARVLDLEPGDPEPLFWALWDAMLIQATDPQPGTREKSIKGLEYIFDRTANLLHEKAANPGTGLADELLRSHMDGKISWREVLENVVNFYMSGAPNPAYLVGSGLEVFAKRPDVMRDFRDKPEIRERVVNEVARMNPVELIITRFPTEDVEIRGVKIPAGSRLKFPIGAVNRDPEVFPNPGEFDYNRPIDASRNLTFGLGTHACAGQLIARAEVQHIFTVVAEQFDSVEIAAEPERVRTDRLVAFKTQPLILH
ncbi:cytochrome P450 [Curtobacterium albidum]|uniref:Cytochrome P450 n=1 Tax=Curtobacterium citreum TaxID=2036 RepID=A0A850DQI1_9MICO|nr:cytochrome P450 [Curtobacterium albidum]NUU27201.1 cytochrome P450 [Curtobacterium albidum]